MAWHKLILGAVQGLGEFLPISSSAHLILIPKYFGWEDFGLAFDVSLHLGTLLAVSVFFRKDLVRLAQSVFRPGLPGGEADRRLVGLLLLATVPGAIAGMILEHRVETVFRSPHLVAWTLIGMGIVLVAADYLFSGRKTVAEITVPMALLIGIAQGIAVVPGISRSGITITMALILGLKRRDAAYFSFLLSVPIIAGAGVLKSKEILHSADKTGLLLGFVGATVFGFLAIGFLLRYVQTRRYTPFAVYRVLVGTFVLTHLHYF
ncbi:MAG: undecaprenyl-diphosphatase UppP [Elusimicrobia bacterium]|nr:undecaprenyl-diphosphatase UppP [Elusimicrobiota bacterium]